MNDFSTLGRFTQLHLSFGFQLIVENTFKVIHTYSTVCPIHWNSIFFHQKTFEIESSEGRLETPHHWTPRDEPVSVALCRCSATSLMVDWISDWSRLCWREGEQWNCQVVTCDANQWPLQIHWKLNLFWTCAANRTMFFLAMLTRNIVQGERWLDLGNKKSRENLKRSNGTKKHAVVDIWMEMRILSLLRWEFFPVDSNKVFCMYVLETLWTTVTYYFQCNFAAVGCCISGRYGF